MLLSVAFIGMSSSSLAHGSRHGQETTWPIACAGVANAVTNPGVKAVTSAIQPASGSNVAYCRVSILYGKSTDQNINIAIALPLNSVDGGSGGLEGAWNGRTQGLGGAGCSGNLLTDVAPLGAVINPGYVASGTDGGHGSTFADITCAAGLNADGTYNVTWIDDFFKEAIKQQILFSKSVARTYYGQMPVYNYWNGCSTGGRQGYLLAQELPKELDGILANAPAINWTRFATAQMWGQIAIKDLTGTPGSISPAKFTYATNAAIAACDNNDGVVDGILDDPRTCTFSADMPALICAANGGGSTDANCLTPAEAAAIDRIWNGPRNAHGEKIWVGFDRGTDLSALSGHAPSPLSHSLMQWNVNDPRFDWKTVTMFGAGGTKSYADVAQAGTTSPFKLGLSLADETDTVGDLDEYRRSGGKLLTFVGMNDDLIQPRGVLAYYRHMAARYHRGLADDLDLQKIDFRNVQEFYRLFRGPGVAHCSGGTGPQPQNLFNTLVHWVEKGGAPKQILAQGGAVPTRTRPLCPYPQTAIYNGSGSIDDAANFRCGGNLETRETVCADILVKYKHETNGSLDYRGTGVNRLVCELK